MKKILPVVIVVLIAVALWFAMSSQSGTNTGGDKVAVQSSIAGNSGASVAAGGTGQGTTGGTTLDGSNKPVSEEDGEDDESVDERPATELYKSADEAIKAIKDGAVDYDDMVLDQFTDLGENCSWCESFYASVKDLLFAADTKPDQKSYFAEVLAISGKVENIKTIVDAIKNAKNQEESDLFSEALELSVGKNDVVKFLGEQLHQSNETLKEASIAAITNQGSRLAVETLHDYTVEKGDPDGFYSMGIGLGEVVPDQESMPYLQNLAEKRDQYSHLAVKALLNGGLDGAKVVIDMLNNSKNTDFDREMLKGAADHVVYDDNVVAYFKQVAETSKNPVAIELAKQVLSDFEQSESEAEQAGMEEAEPFTPLNPN